jgi:hypothetical protein
MSIRSLTISEYEYTMEDLIKQRGEIQSDLNFEEYLGEELYTIFCSYRREDTYKNENYISDGLNNAEMFSKALDFVNTAKQEIVKSGECQHSISANLYNLLIMKEFAPIVDAFELGNWIRCKFDDSVYRLRLISYEIRGKDLSSINTEFSDLTKTANGVNDLKSILQSATSMASSYSYVSKQALSGGEAYESLNQFNENGLSSALINIKNNDNEEVIYNKHGILCRSYDDISDDYSPEQLRITHNILAFTEDNWKTSSLGLGKHDYYYYDNGILTKDTGYGLSSKFVQAGFINGSQIIGGEIYSVNYSSELLSKAGTYINLQDGTFSFDCDKFKYDGNKLSIRGDIYADDLITNTVTANNYFKIKSYIDSLYTDINVLTVNASIIDPMIDPTVTTSIFSDASKISFLNNLEAFYDFKVVGKTTLSSSPIISSDKSKKNSITPLDIKDTANFIYSLKPCMYKYNNASSDEFHHGLIAQDVKESMGDISWGLFVDSNVNIDGNKGLRYEELIADLIATVQSQNERIKILEKQGA